MKSDKYAIGVTTISMGVLLAITFLSAQSTTAPGNTRGYAIGDVQASLLAPDAFKNVHDATWELLDGTPDATPDPQFYRLSGLEPGGIPDARGVFLRGMNRGSRSRDEQRDPKTGDTEPDRPVGDYQEDGIKRHIHPMHYEGRVTGSAEPSISGVDRCRAGNPNEVTTRENQGGGDETRPRNITVYYYVKVR